MPGSGQSGATAYAQVLMDSNTCSRVRRMAHSPCIGRKRKADRSIEEMKCAEPHIGVAGSSMSQMPPTSRRRSQRSQSTPKTIGARATAAPAGPAPALQALIHFAGGLVHLSIFRLLGLKDRRGGGQRRR